eukprot:GHVN01008977.1.p2 GENE.GHVN01008977.1~~GHVN01008977.1.p2  ORF type:complete len:116 (-),score=9.18 GHVN01008977.1:873-1190(-)
MPVTFVLLLISVLYSIFVGYHCIPNLQSEIEPDLRNTSIRNWAIADLVIYNIIFIMLLVCYFLSIVTPAGLSLTSLISISLLYRLTLLSSVDHVLYLTFFCRIDS